MGDGQQGMPPSGPPDRRGSPVRFGVFNPSQPSQPPQSPWSSTNSLNQQPATPRGRKRKPSFDESDSEGDDGYKRARGAPSAEDEMDIRTRLAGLSTASPVEQPQQPPAPPARIPLPRLLSNLDKDALLSVISSLINLHPQLAETVAELVPRPSVASASQLLAALLGKLEASFPYSKWGQDRGDYSFNRVRPQLEDMITRAVEYLDYFADPRNHPDHEYHAISMPFLANLVQLCARLPEWQNPQRNVETRDVLLSRTIQAYHNVVRELGRRSREEGRVYPATQLKQWANEVQALCQRFPGFPGTPELQQIFQQELGWLLGMTETPSYQQPGVGPSTNGLPPALAAILGQGFDSHPVLQGQGQGFVGVGPGQGWEKR